MNIVLYNIVFILHTFGIIIDFLKFIFTILGIMTINVGDFVSSWIEGIVFVSHKFLEFLALITRFYISFGKLSWILYMDSLVLLYITHSFIRRYCITQGGPWVLATSTNATTTNIPSNTTRYEIGHKCNSDQSNDHCYKLCHGHFMWILSQHGWDDHVVFAHVD